MGGSIQKLLDAIGSYVGPMDDERPHGPDTDATIRISPANREGATN